MDWREVKEEIEAEIDKIWWDEPKEITMSRLGVFPSGANVDGQVLGNLYFILSDTQGMGWCTAEPAMKQALDDPDFSLGQCKKMWRYMTVHRARLIGAMDPPGCPAPWLNMGKLYNFCNDVVDSLDSVKTKEELSDLLWSWFNYINCLNRWINLIFPWHLGMNVPLVKLNDIEKLASLYDMKLTK